MKKLLVLLFLIALGTGAYAQKEYVNVVVHNVETPSETTVYLSGAIPSNMQARYGAKIGDVLNMLAEEGFVVEQMSVNSGPNDVLREVVLLSRQSSTPSHIIQTEKADDDSEVHEVARYNLQGMPIGKNEKGVQIVVYSNYTTKTIIVE